MCWGELAHGSSNEEQVTHDFSEHSPRANLRPTARVLATCALTQQPPLGHPDALATRRSSVSEVSACHRVHRAEDPAWNSQHVHAAL